MSDLWEIAVRCARQHSGNGSANIRLVWLKIGVLQSEEDGALFMGISFRLEHCSFRLSDFPFSECSPLLSDLMIQDSSSQNSWRGCASRYCYKILLWMSATQRSTSLLSRELFRHIGTDVTWDLLNYLQSLSFLEQDVCSGVSWTVFAIPIQNWQSVLPRKLPTQDHTEIIRI